VNTSKVEFDQKPDSFELKNGHWICSTCIPKINVKADGTPQKVSGSPYVDMLAVKVIDDSNIETQSTKAGKPASERKYTVSSDGNALTVQWKDFTYANGEPQNGSFSYKRSGAAPASGNKVSGQWLPAKIEDASAPTMIYTLTTSGDELTFKAGTGNG
jgi:hypothetical protein